MEDNPEVARQLLLNVQGVTVTTVELASTCEQQAAAETQGPIGVKTEPGLKVESAGETKL